MIKDEFDAFDSKNWGRPAWFNLKTFIECVEYLICSDEIETALYLLDHPPAWYRENYPKELQEMKDVIYRQAYDVFEYANDDDEASQTKETAEGQWFHDYCYPRGQIITEIVQKLNSDGKTPWIFDLSCSHGNLPMGLLKAGCKISYLGKSMNHRAQERLKTWVGEHWQERPEPEQVTMLVCTEALEHAWNPHDIVHAAKKMNIDYDHVVFSTPLGCLFQGLADWRTRRLGHIRCYTQKEFTDFVQDNFKGYAWSYYRSFSQVIHGVKQ